MSFLRPTICDVAVGVDAGEVAGAEPAVGGEGVGVERVVEVAEEQLRPAHLQLAVGGTRRTSAAPMVRPSVPARFSTGSDALLLVAVGYSVEP